MNIKSSNTSYIDKLYKEENIKELYKELREVKDIIAYYNKLLWENIIILEKEKNIKRLEYEERFKDKIKKYIKDLTKEE